MNEENNGLESKKFILDYIRIKLEKLFDNDVRFESVNIKEENQPKALVLITLLLELKLHKLNHLQNDAK